MYQKEYERWMAADLEDPDLKRNYLRLKEMMMKSRSASR